MIDLKSLTMQELQVLYGKVIAEFCRRECTMSDTTRNALLAGIKSAQEDNPVDLGSFAKYSMEDSSRYDDAEED